MKAMLWTICLLMLGASAGCSRKDPQPSVPQAANPPSQTQSEGRQPELRNASMSVSSDGESAYDADLKKPLEAIRQEAAETDLAQLKEIALRYKQMLSEKQAEIKLISDKLARIPLKERLSTDAQSLATELKTLAAPVEAIKERLQIYVKAIQARGGDPAGLLP